MASPEMAPESGRKFDEPWKLYQRPGKPGIDYDELGMEMAPNARVWKRYVEETDKTDKELVEGWNNLRTSNPPFSSPIHMVAIVQAALFSTISTAFVIESSKDLKPDYSQTTAQTLQFMSRTLTALAKGSTLDEPDTATSETLPFTPSASTIAVNVLWFLSLGMSVAVSLVAILAKEWCHSFTAGRVGSMLRQARLRQQRWDGIEHWRMKEILYVLPLLMHVALREFILAIRRLLIDHGIVISTLLVLFAVGLSLYLWDIDVRVALPVVIITSLAVLFYVVTASLPLFFRFCPYSTALVRFLLPHWLAVLDNYRAVGYIAVLAASISWISYVRLLLKQLIMNCGRLPPSAVPRTGDLESTGGPQSTTRAFSFRHAVWAAYDPIYAWTRSMRGMFSADRSQLVDDVTPMDDVTSSMIAWMISNCEDLTSVDMALQALAGAHPSLPRLPLWKCNAVDILSRRSLTPGIHRHPLDSDQPDHDMLLGEASLYSRSFGFLTEFMAGEGLCVRDTDSLHFALKGSHQLLERIESMVGHAWGSAMHHSDAILYHAWNSSTPRYELAAYEFNHISVEASMHLWAMIEQDRDQCRKQWELLQRIVSGTVTNLPPSAVLALAHGIAKTYIYNPLQPLASPKDLILLRDQYRNQEPITRAVVTGLVVAAFATGSCPIESDKAGIEPTNHNNSRRAKQAYVELITHESNTRAETLMAFGLLCLLDPKTERTWSLDIAEIKAIGARLGITSPYDSYHNALSIIPASFDCGHHLVKLISELLDLASSGDDSKLASPILSRLEAALSPTLCGLYADQLVLVLYHGFMRVRSTKARRLCLRGLVQVLRGQTENTVTALNMLLQGAFFKQTLDITASVHDDLAPFCMAFLWEASEVLLRQISHGDQDIEAHSIITQSTLRSLDNSFNTEPLADSVPADLDAMGLADLWLPIVTNICENNPQSVLESDILSHILWFYEGYGDENAKPRTPKLPRPFNDTWTWQRIMAHLHESCQQAVKQQVERGAPLGQEGRAISIVPGRRYSSKDDRSCFDMYDWSI